MESMEEHIVYYLSPEENLTDILIRLEQTQARSVTLVVPDHAPALQSSVRLRLLRRRASQRQQQVLLVSPDWHLRALAHRVGFATAASLAEQPEPGAQSLIHAMETAARDQDRMDLPEKLDPEEIFGPDTLELTEPPAEYRAPAYTIPDEHDVEGLEADASVADRIRATTWQDDESPDAGDQPPAPALQEAVEEQDRRAAESASAEAQGAEGPSALDLPPLPPPSPEAKPSSPSGPHSDLPDALLDRPTMALPSPSDRVPATPLLRRDGDGTAMRHLSRRSLPAALMARGAAGEATRAWQALRASPAKHASGIIGSYRFLVFSLLLLLLAILLAGAVLLVPSAEVTLYVPTATVDRQISLLAGPDARVSGTTVPAILLQTQKTGTMTGIATGRTDVPGARATGQVIIANNGPVPVTVPRATLLTDTHRTHFATTADVTIQPLNNSQGIPNQAPVPIQATHGGRAGNVPAGAINAFVTASAFPYLTVTNPVPTTGGTDQLVPTVTAADIGVAVDQLGATLRQQETASLRSVRAGDWVSPPHWRQQLIAAPVAGSVAQSATFRVTLRVNGWALLVHDTALRPAASAALDLALARDHLAQMLLPDAPVQAQVVNSVWEGSERPQTATPASGAPGSQVPSARTDTTLQLQVQARGVAGPLLDVSTLRAHIAGNSLLAADRYLLKQAGVHTVALAVHPNWLTRLPFLPSRITIHIMGSE